MQAAFHILVVAEESCAQLKLISARFAVPPVQKFQRLRSHPIPHFADSAPLGHAIAFAPQIFRFPLVLFGQFG